jgi:glycosyltransferase involved in cell wall biosynthesis
MPKISVIIPVYNAALYLRRCLDSVSGQTLRDIEFLCVNDASTDASLDILNEYAKNDARISIINNDNNLGVASSRNLALAKGGGEYVSFVDSDDAIDEDFLEKLYFTAKTTKADIVKGKMRQIAIDGQQIFSEMNQLIKQIGKIAFSSEFWTAIYRQALLKEHNINFFDGMPNATDIAFLNKVTLKADKLVCVDNVYYTYYRRHDSLDSLFLSAEKITSILQILKVIFEEINDAYPQNLADDEYDYIFKLRLLHVLFIVHRNETQQCKEKCAETMIKIFHQCKHPDMLEKKLYSAWPIIYDFIVSSDVAGLTEFFFINNTSVKLFAANFRKKMAV